MDMDMEMDLDMDCIRIIKTTNYAGILQDHMCFDIIIQNFREITKVPNSAYLHVIFGKIPSLSQEVPRPPPSPPQHPPPVQSSLPGTRTRLSIFFHPNVQGGRVVTCDVMLPSSIPDLSNRILNEMLTFWHTIFRHIYDDHPDIKLNVDVLSHYAKGGRFVT
jgi:hypothetical protein